MVDAQASATHQRADIVDQPYQIVGIRRRTATIRELWLKPLGAGLEYLSGEYVLLQDRGGEVPQRSYGHLFARWEILSPRFRFVRALSGANGRPGRDRIRALLPTVCSDLSNHDVFIAGAPGFVLASAEASEAQGAQSRRVHTEAFFVEPHRE